MIRRFGVPPRRGVAHRLRPGAYAVLLGTGARAGRVLLTRTDEIQLPGGGIDPGESPLPALAREVREETGHACRVLRRLGTYRRFAWMPDYAMHAEKLCHVYLGLAGPRLGPPLEPEHHPLWMRLSEAAALVASPGDAAYLAALASGALRPSNRK